MEAHWKSFGQLVSDTQDSIKPRPSDRQLAKTAGMSPQHLGLIKKGLTGTTKEKIISIAQALHADPGIFLESYGFKDPEGRDPDAELARFLQHLEQQIPEKIRPQFRRLVKRQAEVLASEFQAA